MTITIIIKSTMKVISNIKKRIIHIRINKKKMLRVQIIEIIIMMIINMTIATITEIEKEVELAIIIGKIITDIYDKFKINK
jgi:uncharacterized membrane protein